MNIKRKKDNNTLTAAVNGRIDTALRRTARAAFAAEEDDGKG